MSITIQSDVPALAYIENQILGYAIKNGALKQYVEAVENEHKIPPGTLGSGFSGQTQSLSMLYLLLVYPRELWRQQGILDRLDVECAWQPSKLNEDCFKIGNRPSKLSEFSRRLRNAVSHAKVHFFEKGSVTIFEFWDGPKPNETNFKVAMTFPELGEFLTEIGIFFSNNRLASIPNY